MKWCFPLPLKLVGTTIDSYSFLDIDLEKEVEIPIQPHVGSFGIRRRHDKHKGIDLYAPEGTPVYAIEDGEIVELCPFTGPSAGYPWWLDTEGLYIKGDLGIIVYGEIEVNPKIKKGWENGTRSLIKAGEEIGWVRTVIKKDKGRPRSMLHLELHEEGYLHTKQWEIDMETCEGLIDPSWFLKDLFM